MWLKETTASLGVLMICTTLCFWFTYKRGSLDRPWILFSLSFLNILIHVLPLLVSFFISIASKLRKTIKICVFLASIAMSVATGALVYQNKEWSTVSFLLSILYICLTVLEGSLYAIIWVMKRSRRRAMKKNPVIKRRFGSEIRLPSITVSTEARHLRTKQDFTINGIVYIRKGETVELLRTIGSYYSVRNSIGTEYIVPKSHFF